MKSLLHYVSTPAPRYLLRIVILARLFRVFIRGHNKRFLEIGPGLGDISCYLLDHDAIGSGLIIDRAKKAVHLLRQRIRAADNISILCGDIVDLNTTDIFDYVFSFEVLEHIEDDRRFIDHVSRKMAPSGLWFISVPAYMSKWQRQDDYSGHVRRYEEKELREKLEQGGFTIEKIVDYGFPLTTLMRPVRDRYYKAGKAGSRLEKTLDSGVDNKIFSGSKPWLMLALLSPFILLQSLCSGLRRGDGFIVVASKNG